MYKKKPTGKEKKNVSVEIKLVFLFDLFLVKKRFHSINCFFFFFLFSVAKKNKQKMVENNCYMFEKKVDC
jgi:hypothetical protein